MSLNNPKAKESLAQVLYNLSATTGIDIKPQHLETVLWEVKPHSGEKGVQMLEIILRVDVTDDARRREAALAMRQMADAIENPRKVPR